MKKIIIAAVVCAVTVSAILSVPNIIIESIPTAKSVTVQKIEHTEILELNGNIVKNARTGEMTIISYVNEKDISTVKMGQYAEITGAAFPDCIYEGEVSFISDYATTVQKGSYSQTVVEVKIDINNPDDNLKAGYTANAKIMLSEPITMTVVPYEAVNQDDKGEYVYVLEENKAVRRYVTTGYELSDGIEVTSGLSSGDYVITVDDNDSDGKVVLVKDK